MGQTPSHRRREGREAYYLGGDSQKECPYRNEFDREDWIEGWNRAEEEHTSQLDEEQDEIIQMKGSDFAALHDLALWEHYVCDDDCWYSCPKSGECCDDKQVGCNCGADRHNKKVEDLILKILEENQ